MNNYQPTTVAVLGTGVMGAAVARNLARKGFRVRAWNRTADKAQALQADGVQAMHSPADAVRGASLVLTLLKDGDAVAQVMQAAAPGLGAGVLWLQLSTVGIAAMRDLSQWAQQHALVLYDAPVQGTRGPAERGQLVIVASGPLAQRSQAQAVFDAIGQRTLWLSSQPGDSSRLKLALNHWALSLTQALAESLALAKGLGVDPAAVVDVVTGGPMDSGFFQAKAQAMLSGDYRTSFSVANALKDAQLLAEGAQCAGLTLELAQASLARFERALLAGHGDKDMAASYLV